MATESATDVELPSEKAAVLKSSSVENDGQPSSPEGEQYFMSGPKSSNLLIIEQKENY